jgi:hypothetical protein
MFEPSSPQQNTSIESPFKKLWALLTSKAQSISKITRDYNKNEDNPNTVEKHGTTCVPSFHTFTWTKVRGRRTKNNKHTLRPSPNERTCMGWHERHASLRRGSRGILRPEALNLEA